MTEPNENQSALPHASLSEQSDIAEIIAAFESSTAKLQASHANLQARVAQLTGELSHKNEELSATLTEVSGLKNYLANILESITDGVLAIDLDARVVALNHAAAEIVPGLPAAREGMALSDILPENCAALGALLKRALYHQERITNAEITLPRDDAPPRTLSIAASPILDDAGIMRGAVQTFRDLTEIKALEERATRQERLAALGEMAAGVAHEIRNPLGGIELYASLLQRELATDSREAGLCEKISNATSSLNRIVEDMLTFTRSREPMLRPVSAQHICHLALELAASHLEEKNIRVTQAYDEAADRLPLDADLLSRACLNVILNAVQVMELGGELRISAHLQPTESGGRRVLTIRIADDGAGIPPEIVENIFHPFFTTRKEGTGLGLAIVHKIVHDHGGEIRVENNAPHGTIFIFDLPV